MASSKVLRFGRVGGAVLALLGGMGLAAPAEAGIPLVTPPPGAIVVNFDDAFPEPGLFGNTTALRTRYSPVGVNFSGPGNDGGAVLKEGNGFGISGFSPPNILAFNKAATMQGGGKPQFPQTLTFNRPIRYLQFNVGDSSGLTITAEAFDAQNNSLGSESVNPLAAMQTLVLEGRHIKKVVISGGGLLSIIDDVAFILDTTVIDFDESPSPSSLSNAAAIRDRYIGKGVRQTHINAFDGPGVLQHSMALGVTGFSPPNVLVLNDAEFLNSGGKPKFPLYLLFNPPVKSIRMLAGDPGGSTLTAEAYNANGEVVDSMELVTGAAMQPIELAAPAINTLIVTSTGTSAVFDDLEFLVAGTLIDFEDQSSPPTMLGQATAIRDRYKALGVRFTAPGNDGPALLGSNTFGVTGLSGTNFLAFDASSGLVNGGTPQLPVTLHFDPPVKRVEMKVGSNAGTRIFFAVEDVVGGLGGTTDLITTSAMQTLNMYTDGMAKLTITSNGPIGVIDDLAFASGDPCAFDICYQGDTLEYYCSSCVTRVCAEDSNCCNDAWTQTCALNAERLCGSGCDALCGDANRDRKVTSTDALAALRTAVGTSNCPLVRCDFNGDESIKAGDALQILRTGVGQTTNPNCFPSTMKFGFPIDFFETTTVDLNYLLGLPVTVDQAGVVTHLGLIGRGTGAQVKMALYTDSSNSPGSLVAATPAVPVADGSKEIPVNTVATIQPGKYWVMAVYDQELALAGQQAATPGNVIKYKSFSFAGSIPATFGTPDGSYDGPKINYWVKMER
jgi:hypothetical protein